MSTGVPAALGLLDSYAKIHAAQLGVLLALLAVTMGRHDSRATYPFLIVGVAAALAGRVAAGPVGRNPGHFLAGALIIVALREWLRGVRAAGGLRGRLRSGLESLGLGVPAALREAD